MRQSRNGHWREWSGEAASAVGSRRLFAGVCRHHRGQDASVARQMRFEPDTLVVFDRGYTDYEWFEELTARDVRRDNSQCPEDPNLDSTDCSAGDQVSADAGQLLGGLYPIWW